MIGFVPSDNVVMTEKYLVDKGGCCGQACLAVIEQSTIQAVFDSWNALGLDWKGYSGWRQLKSYLELKGFTVKQCRSLDATGLFIARVQWLGEGSNKAKPFFGWGHWTTASAYTHFIVIEDGRFFCNETGWGNDLGVYLNGAEPKGVITSYFKITKGGGVDGSRTD